MLRRTQTAYIEADPFFSPRGKVLHGFDQFLQELSRAQIPCVWMTGWTRAQLDEPRRRLGQNHPYIGENGGGVYLPEDYFHLKASNTIRLGRYTCIPVAKPQPAAAEGLAELSSDLGISVVPLRSLSQRELSQNTGLPAREAELIRQRDFDEPFFFAGANQSDIEKFHDEAKRREMVIKPAGAFWSLSCGASLARCIRELGALYDRALRAHALRAGVRLLPAGQKEARWCDEWPTAALDKTLTITERAETEQVPVKVNTKADEPASADERASETPTVNHDMEGKRNERLDRNRFYLHVPDVWGDLVAAIEGSTHRSRAI